MTSVSSEYIFFIILYINMGQEQTDIRLRKRQTTSVGTLWLNDTFHWFQWLQTIQSSPWLIVNTEKHLDKDPLLVESSGRRLSPSYLAN